MSENNQANDAWTESSNAYQDALKAFRDKTAEYKEKRSAEEAKIREELMAEYGTDVLPQRIKLESNDHLLVNNPISTYTTDDANFDIPDVSDLRKHLTDKDPKSLVPVIEAVIEHIDQTQSGVSDNKVRGALQNLTILDDAGNKRKNLHLVNNVVSLNPMRNNATINALKLDVKQISFRTLKTSLAFRHALLQKEVNLAVDRFITESAKCLLADGANTEYNLVVHVPIIDGSDSNLVSGIVINLLEKAVDAATISNETIQTTGNGYEIVGNTSENVKVYTRTGTDCNLIVHFTTMNRRKNLKPFTSPEEKTQNDVEATLLSTAVRESGDLGLIGGDAVLSSLLSGDNALGLEAFSKVPLSELNTDDARFALDVGEQLENYSRCFAPVYNLNGVLPSKIDDYAVLDVTVYHTIVTRLQSFILQLAESGMENASMIGDRVMSSLSSLSVPQIDLHISYFFGMMDNWNSVKTARIFNTNNDAFIAEQTSNKLFIHNGSFYLHIGGNTDHKYSYLVIDSVRNDESALMLRIVENNSHINDLGEIVKYAPSKITDGTTFPNLLIHRYSSKKLRLDLAKCKDTAFAIASLHALYDISKATGAVTDVSPSINATVSYRKVQQ